MIYISGGSKAQRDLAESLYIFCSQELLIKKSIDVDLKIQDLTHAQAWTDHEGDGKFYLEIEKNLNKKQFIVAFCHEMIHVTQHLQKKPVSEHEAYQLECGLVNKFIGQ